MKETDRRDPYIGTAAACQRRILPEMSISPGIFSIAALRIFQKILFKAHIGGGSIKIEVVSNHDPFLAGGGGGHA